MEAPCKVEDDCVHGVVVGSLSSSSSSSSIDDASNSSNASSSSDFMEDDDATSSCSHEHGEGPMFEMGDLLEDLPIKRGLSRHYQGKSQSFTSLANVRSLEDLVKPVRMCRRRSMKTCKSYGGGLDAHKPQSPRGITKRPSRGSLTSLVGLRRSGFVGRPPIHPHASGNLPSQALLFASS